MDKDSTIGKPISVGLLGLGRAGINIHYEALRKDSKYSVTAVCDTSADRCEETAKLCGARIFKSLHEMIDSEFCELIVVATPSSQHFSDAKMILEAGLDCVLEKPMATTAADSKKLVEIAQLNNRKLFVHHQHLFGKEYLFLQEIISSGVFGKIFHIEVFWTNFVRRWDWQTLKKNGGGQILNTCPHLLTILLPLLGGDLCMEAVDVRQVKDAGDAEDHVKMHMRGKNGITASALVSSACAIPLPRMTLLGASGTLQVNGSEATLRFFDPSEMPVREVIDDAAPKDGSLGEKIPWQEKTLPVCPSELEGKQHNATTAFYDAVAVSLRENAPFAIDLVQASRMIEILEQVLQS